MEEVFDYKNWPWPETSPAFPKTYNDRGEWPKISVIIPSFNQGAFVEETIRSILYQNYPNLELIVIDGGSKDETVEILKKYEKHIAFWVSEPDKGQSHAINKGLERSTGDWIAWLNSDDCYLENAFYHLFVESDIKRYDFLYGNYKTGKNLSESREIKVMESGKVRLSNVIRFFFGIDYIIPSQSVFVKRSLLERVGLLDESLHYCMDLDWYARILLLDPLIYKYDKTICFFRYNKNTKTGSLANKSSMENKMGMEAEMIAKKYARYLNAYEKIKFNNLYHYYLMYSKEPQKYENCSFWYLLKILLRHPFKSIGDRRILGLWKKKIMFT